MPWDLTAWPICRYSEAAMADVCWSETSADRQRVAQIPSELGIHIDILYTWSYSWRLQGDVERASVIDPDGWSAADKFTVRPALAGFNGPELSAYCRERGLFSEQVDCWRQAAQIAIEIRVLILKELN